MTAAGVGERDGVRDLDGDEMQALVSLPPEPPVRGFPYGEHAAQVVDLYGDETADQPVVALLHGGFWRERFDRAHLTPLAAALATDLGCCVALVEYRRVGGGGGWPHTFDDIAPALAALPGARPVTLVGHSAGGHLALWAAARCPAAVGRTVAIAPVADLAYGHELGLGRGAVADLLGGADRVADRLGETDPMRQRAPESGPVTLLHGTADTRVPVELSHRYAKLFGATLREFDGVGHYAPVTPHTQAYKLLVELLS